MNRNKKAREEAYEQIKTLKELHELILHSVGDGIYGVDTQGNTTFVNEAAAQIAGWRSEDVLGKSLHAIHHHSYPDGSPFPSSECPIYQAFTDGAIHQGEQFFWHANGTCIPVEYISTPIREDGNIKGAVVIFRDITERNRNKKAREEAKRMQGELNVAKEIQLCMLPQVFPAYPDRDEFRIHASMEAAREVGGDFYDFFFIDEDRLCVVIGDVSGKGVPAALFMAITKALIKSRSADDLSTASILTHVNNEISTNNEAVMFITVFMGIIDVQSGEMTYTNAGHNPPYIKRQDGALNRLDSLHGPVLGVIDGLAYKEGQIQIEAGDLLLMYTDGVTEAMNPDLNLFEESRLVDILNEKDHDTPLSIINEVFTRVHAFENGAEQADDITLLALLFKKKKVNEAIGTLV